MTVPRPSGPPCIPDHSAPVPCPGCAHEDAPNPAAIRAAALHEAADFLANNDWCRCGGCDSCVVNKYARRPAPPGR